MFTTQTIGNRGVLFCTDALTGYSTYCYLIKGKTTNYLVDTGLGSDTAININDYIGHNCPNKVIVINTHYHWDHIWGNIGFKGSAIYSHRFTPGIIKDKWDEMLQKGGKYIEGRIEQVLPNELIDDGLLFREDGVELFYSPGHTVDSLSVYDRVDKVLHVGDNMETPFPDIHDTKEHAVNSWKRYLEYDFHRCISGHNGDVKREDIIAAIKAFE